MLAPKSNATTIIDLKAELNEANFYKREDVMMKEEATKAELWTFEDYFR